MNVPRMDKNVFFGASSVNREASPVDYPVHGGDRKAAATLAGLQPEDLLDFSSSVNPLPLPPCVRRLLAELEQNLREYPDPNSSRLKEELERTLNIDRDRIVVANGSTELIYLLPFLLESKSAVCLAVPCFSEYKRAFDLANFPVHEIPSGPANGFQPEIDCFMERLERIPNLGAAVVGHPNSPAGNLWKEQNLLSLLSYCEDRNVFLVVDETFMDFCGPGRSLLPKIPDSRFLVVVRSMTKFYGLAGLRLGYGVMHPRLVEAMEKRRIPWSVNLAAQKIGAAVLQDREFAEQTRAFIRKENPFLRDALGKTGFLEVFSSDVNFFLVRLRGIDLALPDRFYMNLLRDGILLRNCGNFDGLDKSYFRIAVRAREDNEKLVAKLVKNFSLLNVGGI
ncbi:MAG: threonine-phosphate decarboxylase [Nitrospinae bacterium]|nr:threonine-phosphate decarboxylase [Nitrospinota bacterium]